jgi:hypothetical protein
MDAAEQKIFDIGEAIRVLNANPPVVANVDWRGWYRFNSPFTAPEVPTDGTTIVAFGTVDAERYLPSPSWNLGSDAPVTDARFSLEIYTSESNIAATHTAIYANANSTLTANLTSGFCVYGQEFDGPSEDDIVGAQIPNYTSSRATVPFRASSTRSP